MHTWCIELSLPTSNAVLEEYDYNILDACVTKQNDFLYQSSQQNQSSASVYTREKFSTTKATQ